VTRGHPLLEDALADADCHTVDVTWETHDHHGHGTEMAGIALYGDLVPALAGHGSVPLRHRLESVKILPPGGANDPDLYGAITADAASRAELQAPARRRVYSMAVATLDTRDRGQPTSWSSALDALAAGRSFDPSSKGLVYFDEAPHPRLFVVSAGNVQPASLARAHLDRSDTEPVHDPAQAWNALTVGAYTEKAIIDDPAWNDWSPVAPPGDLSPWSTTSVTFAKQWPIKPDVVMEGGNIVHDAADDIDFPCDDLCLLTTHYKPADKLLVSTWGTSAATAQAARLAASVSAFYPDMWPETIRGLLVHSAEWTPAMKKRLDGVNGKRARAQLVRRYGFGVPSLERALGSAGNAVTLLVQDSIRPFDDGNMREFHLHELPWPGDVLASIGEATARVRVTLSYFIEPNPGRRGWGRKHRYQSHGLRFDVKGPNESLDMFRKRLNQMALDEDEDRPTTGGDSADWYLGEQMRKRGSLHSDILAGSAAEIAARGVIAVFPVTGWWKELKKRDRSNHGARYALLVSIETDAVNADIWTPIAAQVGIPVETEISFETTIY
jgi:Subtilase family